MCGPRRTASLAVGVLLLSASVGRAADQETINRAIDRGVAALKRLQGRGGTWAHAKVGATALAGLALVECEVPADDRSVARAADAVRRASPSLTDTYSLSLSLLFLDRLGDPADVPLIESLAVRLLAGQAVTGGWGYECPPISRGEVERLATVLRQRNELKAGRPLPRGPKRTARDLPRPIQLQLAQIARMGFGGPPMPADNSNTQFGTLALWVAHRHGLPVGGALRRVEAYFRLTQNMDGGWPYLPHFRRPGEPPIPPGVPIPPGLASTAPMTCAGLLGLAVGHGVRADRAIDKDRALKAALLALGTAIGNAPDQRQRPGGGAPRLGGGHGKVYYFLWSLERVAVILNLNTIGKKDWYGWGTDLLLANQAEDGCWRGEYANCGADTCFALLFLKRANLAADLSARLGKVKDPAEVELRPGGVGGAGLTGRKKGIRHALAPEDKDSASADNRPKERKTLKPIPAEVENARAGKLSDALVQATGDEQDVVLKQLRDRKGVDYTEAILLALPRLDDAARRKAREALVQRFGRLTAKSLLTYLKDVDPEARRAAVLASAEKGLRHHIPAIIERLSDSEPSVARAAHAALKALSEKDFGPAADATPAEAARAVAAWKAWWRGNGKK